MTRVDAYSPHRQEVLYPHGQMTDPQRAKVFLEEWDTPRHRDLSRPIDEAPYWLLKGAPTITDKGLWQQLQSKTQGDPDRLAFVGLIAKSASGGPVFVVSPTAELSWRKRNSVLQQIKSALATLELGCEIEVSMLPVTVLETFRGVVERVEDDTASVSLYDIAANTARMTIDIPKEDFIANEVPFRLGAVFEFSVQQTGRSETFVMRDIPMGHLTAEEMQAEEARVDEAFNGE